MLISGWYTAGQRLRHAIDTVVHGHRLFGLGWMSGTVEFLQYAVPAFTSAVQADIYHGAHHPRLSPFRPAGSQGGRIPGHLSDRVYPPPFDRRHRQDGIGYNEGSSERMCVTPLTAEWWARAGEGLVVEEGARRNTSQRAKERTAHHNSNFVLNGDNWAGPFIGCARSTEICATRLESRRAERRVHSACMKKRQPGDMIQYWPPSLQGVRRNELHRTICVAVSVVNLRSQWKHVNLTVASGT
ncbi:hypothetical protein FB451DRAFT_1184857 [Mycena latifolia]|nr:hypothetical protein FB451DRAFT_1184857 [Mycena latifolia]